MASQMHKEEEMPSSPDVVPSGGDKLPSPDVDLPGEETSPSSDVILPGEEKPPSSDVILTGEEKPPSSDVILSGEEKPPSSDVILPGEEKPPSSDVILPGEEKPPSSDVILPTEQNVGELEDILRTKLGTETWNDRMKKLIAGLVGMVNPGGIPVGKFISTLIGFFWPNSALDIWELVKDQVEYMIDQKILEAEVNQLRNSLDGLHETMKQYVEAKPHEKGALMGAIMASCNDLHSRLVKSNNVVNLIPLTVTLSYMHLANLKERLVHGKEIYQEDNTEVWRNDLMKTIQTYKEDFQTIYAKWQDWRRDSIVVTTGEYKSPTTIPPFFFYVFTGEVNDKVSGEKRDFKTMQSTTVSNPTYFKEICDTAKAMLWKRANGAMLQTLLPTFFVDNFMPGSEENISNPDPSMLKAEFGPFSYNVIKGSNANTRDVYYPSSDNRADGAVTQVNVREWNLIDGLQFYYNGTWGTFVGNSGGGKLHEVEAKGRLVKKVICSFNNGGMVDLEIIFSDGQSSGRLGNRGDWIVTRVDSGGIDSFGLKNVKMTGHSGVTQIELFYEHFTCRPSDININTK